MALNPRAEPFEPGMPAFLDLYGDLQAIKTYHTLLSHAATTAESVEARAQARQAVRALHEATASGAAEAGRRAVEISAGRR